MTKIQSVINQAYAMYPYKEQGNKQSYSEYNEGWTDAVGFIERNLTSDNEGFVSDDKLTINLPVPLGSTIYSICSTCGDFCRFQSEKFREIQNPTIGPSGSIVDARFSCRKNALCHTRFTVRPVVLNYFFLESVLDEWGKYYFATEEEAQEAGIKLINERREKMREFGFYVSESGYGYKGEER